jgi:sulfur-oxidizing protein SoxY
MESAVSAAIGDRALRPADLLQVDLPAAYDFGSTIPLGIVVSSPMTAVDHVRRVSVFAQGNPFPEVATLHFTPANGQAHATTRIRLNEGTQRVVAVAELSDGRALVAERSIEVAISGCSAESGAGEIAAMPMPEPRLKLPTAVRPGEVVEVRTMISHWMETGLRRDAQDRPIPRRIINRMVCELDGEQVFAADLTPAVAANAYLSFPLRARGSGRLTFTWSEDGGAIYRIGQDLAVS